jgi:hypothetical protein
VTIKQACVMVSQQEKKMEEMALNITNEKSELHIF